MRCWSQECAVTIQPELCAMGCTCLLAFFLWLFNASLAWFSQLVSVHLQRSLKYAEVRVKRLQVCLRLLRPGQVGVAKVEYVKVAAQKICLREAGCLQAHLCYAARETAAACAGCEGSSELEAQLGYSQSSEATVCRGCLQCLSVAEAVVERGCRRRTSLAAARSL